MTIGTMLRCIDELKQENRRLKQEMVNLIIDSLPSKSDNERWYALRQQVNGLQRELEDEQWEIVEE